MTPKGLLRTAPLVLALIVGVLMLRANLAGAAAGSTTDPDDVTGVDIKQVTWSDDDTKITLGFTTYDAMANNSDIRSEWLFDLNGDTVPAEACVLLKVVASNPIFEFYNSGTCGPEVAQSGSVAKASDSLEFNVPLQTLREAGLSSTATQYGFRVRSTTTSSGDKVPDLDADLLIHILGAAATGTPTPSASPTSSATATPTPSASASSSPTPSPSPTPCPTATPTPSPTPTPSSTPTTTPNASPTASPSAGCDTSAQGTASKTTVSPGESVQISGSGFTSTSTLEIEFRSAVTALGAITSTATGDFTTAVRIPSDATAGQHHIAVVGPNPQGGTHTVLFPVVVAGTNGGATNSAATGGSASASGGLLPKTGAGILTFFVLAVLFILGGLLITDESSMWRRRLVPADRKHGWSRDELK